MSVDVGEVRVNNALAGVTFRDILGDPKLNKRSRDSAFRLGGTGDPESLRSWRERRLQGHRRLSSSFTGNSWKIMYIASIFLSVAVYSQATKLCGIRDQRSAIVGNNLYFTSGNYTFDDGEPYHNTSSLYILPLDSPIDVSGPIPLDQFNTIPIPSQELGGGVLAGGSAGTFLWNHDTLYAYGGIIGGDANGTQNGLWSFNITTQEWDLTIVEGGDLSYGDDTEGVWANDPSQSLSFYTGGWEMAYNNTNNGLVKLDSSTPDAPQWNFVTAQSGDMQGPDILKGGMTFVRKGQAGILVALGGFNTTKKGTQFSAAAGWDWDYRSMAQIWVYDIFSNVWYIVPATGDVPSERGEFAIDVSSAPDDSSFQITIYGGYDLFYDIGLDDVYVLTIPSFQWVKASPGNSKSGGYKRPRVKGNMFEDAQFIISGGITSKETCQPNAPPILVLNTSSLEWQNYFDPGAAAYVVPEAVTNIIGGDGQGGATQKSPRGGWNDTDLANIFSHTISRDSYIYPNGSHQSANGTGPNIPKNGTNANNDTGGSDATGAIAGGVVGGVAGLAIVGGIAWFCWRRRRQSNRPTEMHGQSYGPVAVSELPSKTHRAQLETKTDRAELDEQRYATELAGAMQGLQPPAELEDRQTFLRTSSDR